MTFVVVDAPAEMPVELDAVKSFLNYIGGSERDVEISSLIESATAYTENFTRRFFVERNAVVSLASFYESNLGCRLLLPSIPVLQITSVEYIDTDGSAKTLPDTTYSKTPGDNHCYLYRNDGGAWPSVKTGPEAVKISYKTGYGDASKVPGPIKTAIMLKIQQDFDRSAGDYNALQRAIESLLNMYIVRNYA